jgi:hypothetical protein
MIANALREDIESYSVRAKSNPLYVKVASGNLDANAVAKYLSSVLCLLRHTPEYLVRARARALERGMRGLASYFSEKLKEEKGHDAWAESDLASVGDSFGATAPADLSPALRSLLDYLADTIDEDPTLYLAYILFAEYFTVLEAPEWLTLLEERCGIPKAFMSAVANHAELDKDHVAEGLDAIDALVTDPAYLVPMRQALHESITRFDRFLAEVAN